MSSLKLAPPTPVQWLLPKTLHWTKMICGEGLFNITRSDTNIFSMEFSLHHNSDEEFALYEYTMGGDGEYMAMFDHIFDFGWEKNVASSSSRSQPVKRIEMILTDKNNGCKITCSLAK